MPHFIRSARLRAHLRTLDVRADDTDARDYVFQPALGLLPERIDHRGRARVLDQGREGACVGFALAAVVNVSLAARGGAWRRERVSARMLYEMGRRYDEWDGESDEGTSLRGAMKGWHKHGVTTERLWPSTVKGRGRRAPDRLLTEARARDALRRPIGAYYRIVDSDVSHMQAAVAEGEAVLASAWVHAGWQQEHLGPPWAGLRVIRQRGAAKGLHAFAIVGYGPDGFIVQNSWGPRWGTRGRALLPYDDWFDNRQDAWVARPGPETRDAERRPRIFVVGFAGGEPDGDRAETSAVGLDIDAAALPYLVNTGDQGALSSTGSLVTLEDELPAMAERALLLPVLADGARHVVLYAHGGLGGEAGSAVHAAHLRGLAAQHGLGAWFFIWESGITESVLGWLRSGDDASGPAGFSWQEAWDAIKDGAGQIVSAAQRALGKGLAPVVREVFWDEMKGRARGAARPRGGAALFAARLFEAMARVPTDRFKLHLVAHSAGALYLAELYEKALRGLLAPPSHVSLASVHFMAPAVTIAHAREIFAPGGAPVLARDRFRVHLLSTRDEEADSIQIYPSSLLTYVADHLESGSQRRPLLGLRGDFDAGAAALGTGVDAAMSVRHGEFDDPGHEVETVLAEIGAARW